MSNKFNIKKYNKKSKKNKKIKIMYGGLKCDNPNNKAYMMLGHGGTTREILDVPENCVYITKTICGTVTFESVNDSLQHLFCYNKKLVKNPCNINNFNELNKAMSQGSQADKYIGNVNQNYRIDDENNFSENANYLNMHISKKTCDTLATCPKKYLFQYKNAIYEPCEYWFYKGDEPLMESWNSIKEKHNIIHLKFSGLISADNCFYISPQVRLKSEGTPWKYPMLTAEMIKILYTYSLYPTFENILNKIAEQNIDINSYLKITDPNDPNYFDPSKRPTTDLNNGEYYEEPFEYIISGYDFVKLIIDTFSVTQSKLFEMFPGVHYNNVCRGFYEPTDLYDKLLYPKKMQRQMSVDNKENLLNLYEEEKEAEKYSSVGDAPIYNFPRLEKLTSWFGKGGKNKKTRRHKRCKNKTQRNKRCKNKK